MNDSKIGLKEAICLILTIAIAHSIISTPRTLLATMGSSVLLNLLYISIIIVFIITLVIRLYKQFPGSDILDISEYLGGTAFKRILGIIFITYFMISGSLLLREFAEAVRIIYYPNTKVFFIILMFVISTLIVCKLDFTSTINANFLIIPVVMLSCIFLFISNFQNFNVYRIFPILGNGFFNTFILGLSNISSFAGISLLYFLPPLLKEPQAIKKIGISSVIVFFIFLLLNVIVLLFMFSHLMVENELLPLYTASQYIQIGDFFVRFEVLFLLIWIEIFVCYLCIICKFCMLILKKITNVKDSKIYAYPFSILLLSISLLPDNIAQIKNYNVKIYPYICISFCYVFCILLLVFANLKRNKEKKVVY